MDSLAIAYAGEIARWGIETVIVSPGVYTTVTNHFPNADVPDDKAREAEDANGPTLDLAEQVKKADENVQTGDMDPADVARAVVKLVAMPYGKRPFRVTVDPTDGGADEIDKIATVCAPPISSAPAWPTSSTRPRGNEPWPSNAGRVTGSAANGGRSAPRTRPSNPPTDRRSAPDSTAASDAAYAAFHRENHRPQQADQLKNDSIRFWLPHHRPVPQLQLAMNGVRLATHFSSR